MTNKNEQRKVPELRFPEFSGEWEVKKAEEIFISISDKNHNGDLTVLSATQDRGMIPRNNVGIDIKFEEKSLKNYKKTLPGDFIISLRSFQGGFEYNKIAGLVSPAYTVLRYSENKYDDLFFKEYFKSQRFIRKLDSMIYGIRDGKSISFKDFSGYKLMLPMILEQQKIGEFFSKLDRQIELEEKKLALLEEQKKGYMQKIFSQELRFKDENGEEYPEWEEKAYNKIFIEKNELITPSQEYPLMAFTSSGNVEEKGEKYDRSFLVKNSNKKYKKTNFNDFIYSSNNLLVGSIGLNKFGNAVISDVYEIFEINMNNSALFISSYIKTPYNIHKLIKFRQGALYGQYKIHARDFLNIKNKFPSKEEQEKIGVFIELMNVRIKKSKEKLIVLKKIKTKLLKLMLI